MKYEKNKFTCFFVGDDFKVKNGAPSYGYAKTGLICKAKDPGYDFSSSFPSNFGKKLFLDNQEHLLVLLETSGMDKKEPLLKLTCKSADAFVLLFSVKNRETFANLPEWFDVIKSMQSQAKIMLLGITDDFGDSDDTLLTKRVIMPAEANEFAVQMGAMNYLECSIHDSARIEKVLTILCGALKGKNLDTTPAFFKNYFYQDTAYTADLSNYIKGAMEIAKGRRQASSILSVLPEEMIFQILNEAGKTFAMPEAMNKLVHFILNAVPKNGGIYSNPKKPGLCFFEYKRLEPAKPVEENANKTPMFCHSLS